jgi:hypothetical protein
VTEGIQSAIPEGLINVPLGLYNNTYARRIWERMSNTFDAFNNRWNQWVLGYDRNRQRLFLSNFGLGGLNREELMVGLIVVVVVSLAITAIGLFRQSHPAHDKARYWYDRFRRRLTRAGIRIYPHEGPADLANRASRLRDDLAAAIHRITDSYIGVRYGNQAGKLEALKAQVRMFKPAKRVPA